MKPVDVWRLADEIAYLVGVQRWYERPEKLDQKKIKTLIGLDSVTLQARGETDAFNERLIALGILFCMALADSGDPEMSRDGLTYIGLDDDPVLRRATLATRREVIAERRGKSAERFRRQEEHVLRGLIAGQLARYEDAEQAEELMPDWVYEELGMEERGVVRRYRRPDQLKMELVGVVNHAREVLACVGFPAGSSEPLSAITHVIAQKIIHHPDLDVYLVMSGEQSDLRQHQALTFELDGLEPRRVRTVLYGPARYPLGPVLVCNERECRVALPLHPGVDERRVDLCPVIAFEREAARRLLQSTKDLCSHLLWLDEARRTYPVEDAAES